MDEVRMNGIIPQLKDTVQGMMAVRDSGAAAEKKVELYEVMLDALRKIVGAMSEKTDTN